MGRFILLSLLAAVPATRAGTITRRPYSTPIVSIASYDGPASPASTSCKTSSTVPANTNGPKAPRNVAYIAYAYEDQWVSTNTSMPPIDVESLYQNMTGVDALFINPCDVQEKDPSTPQCHGWDFTNSTYWKQIYPMYQAVQSSGIKLFASFGGYESTTFYLLNQNFTKYYEPIVSMLKDYKFDGIDFDIEPAPSSAPYNSYVPDGIDLPLKLVNSIRKDMGDDFLLTFAPVSSDLLKDAGDYYAGFSSYELDQKAVINTTSGPVKSINWFNPQFYSGGGEPSVSDYESIISNGSWDPTRIVMLDVTTSNEGSGWVNLSQIESMAKSLTKQYGSFGGIGGYDYARAGESDGVTNWQWYKAVGKALGVAS